MVAQKLLEMDAKVFRPNNQGNTALHVAAMRGHVDVVLLLLANGGKARGNLGAARVR